MSKKLFIHIGTHRTGSTVIQSTLSAKSDELKSEGIVLIEHVPSAEEFKLLTSPNEEIIRTSREFFVNMMKRYPRCDKFLISWEGYSGNLRNGYKNTSAVAETLSEITKGLDASIIVYLRRQDSFIESAYTFLIQGTEWMSFQDYINGLDPRSFDWYLLLNSFAKYFPMEKIIVRRYDKEALPNKNSLTDDFANVIGSTVLKDIDLEHIPLEKGGNRGYSRDALEIARLCNQYLDEEGTRFLRKILQRTNAKEPFEDYSFFTLEERRNFLSQYSDSNSKVARTYLSDPSGKLFSALNPNEHSERKYEGLTPAAISRVLTLAIVDIQRRHEEESIGSMTLGRILLSVVRKTEYVLRKILDRIPGARRSIWYLLRKLKLM